jgi:V8-like Glu-specific endopeptidase
MGPNGEGDFWTHTVAGSEALFQVRHRGTADALKSVYFEIDEVGFLSDRFVPGLTRTMGADAAKAFCSFNEPCVFNADCGNPDAAVDTARNAVGWMLFKSGRYWYICTGGLLADSDPGSQIPYFLTANHCISREREADTLETTFFYTSSCNTCNTSTTPSTIGADIVSGSRTSDYTLLQLNQPAPGGAAFLGWNSNPVAFAHGTHLYRISHPAGAPQAYSEHDVDTTKGTCTSWPRGDWIYSQDFYGATEGGSSGSPVVNGAGEVVGQLSGGCGTDVYNTCNAVDNATVDGAFAAYYSNVAQWLGPGSACGDGDGDGYNDASCGGDDCNDGDPSVNPGAAEICDNGIDDDCDGATDGSDGDCTVICDNDGDGVDGVQCGGNDCDDFNALIRPGLTEICDDGFDNDCNGLTDGNDPACASSCSPVGVPCSANSDCCSNKCRGRGGSKTCR